MFDNVKKHGQRVARATRPKYLICEERSEEGVPYSELINAIAASGLRRIRKLVHIYSFSDSLRRGRDKLGESLKTQ